MTQQELKEKYGDATVMVVPRQLVEKNLQTPFVAAAACPTIKDVNIIMSLRNYMTKHAAPMLRYLAETDASVKQIVAYVILRDRQGRIYLTRRKDGDERLVGRASIGTGGHIDGGEAFAIGMYRELKEEVGLTPDDVLYNQFSGYIYDPSDDVGKVHVGFVYLATVQDPARVSIQEKEKLVGEWVDYDTLKTIYENGELESWSELAFKHVVKPPASPL